jgi:hypothetical protein
MDIIWSPYWFEYIYRQDMRNHYIHMIRIEVEVIKRIGQAKVNHYIHMVHVTGFDLCLLQKVRQRCL